MLRKALVASFIGSSNKGHEVVMKSTENRYFLRWSYVARHRRQANSLVLVLQPEDNEVQFFVKLFG